MDLLYRPASSIRIWRFVIYFWMRCLSMSLSLQHHLVHEHMTRDDLHDVFGVTSQNEVHAYEITYPVRVMRGDMSMSRDEALSQSDRINDRYTYMINGFGKEYVLDVQPSSDLFSSDFLLHHWHGPNTSSLRARRASDNWFGQVRGADNSAVAITIRNGRLNGLVTTGDIDFFIKPLPQPIEKLVHHVTSSKHSKRHRDSAAYPHIVYQRAAGKTCDVDSSDLGNTPVHFENRNIRPIESDMNRKFIEVMVVSDSTMFEYHGNDLENYLTTLMNIAAGAFKSPSIGANISLHVVRYVVLESQEVDPMIGPDSRTSLRNFCEWQKLVYPENIHHSEHFDVATLITRHDLSRPGLSGTTEHGVLGLAHMASACIKSRRCSIVQDHGLNTGLTVAHEIGHTLAMQHDGPRNACPPSGHIMASVTSSGPGAFTWSQCSAQYLQKYLNSLISHCLNDPPTMHMNKDLTLYRGWRPGQLFHRSEQCKYLYSDSPGACPHRNHECDKLWCERSGSKGGNRACSTNQSPPAEGTECGDGRWCIAGHCVEYGNTGPDPIHGGWSEWETMFSECSRTCGGGIRRKHRYCISPYPTFGGEQCMGDNVLMKTCNLFDCEHATQYLFAQEQCTAKNAVPYADTFTMWEPYADTSRITGDDFCKMYCASYDLMKAVRFGKFVDGTRCDVLSPLSADIGLCVNGLCKRFGCDLVENSGLVFDSCAVCVGDNTICEMQSGRFQGGLTSGYATSLDIPRGSTFINITQHCRTCHLAIQIDNRIIFGGFGRQAISKIYTHGSDVILYVRDNPEIIQIKGPTASDIRIKVFTSSDEHPDVHWVFFRPSRPRPEYEWRRVRGTCSKTCGFGMSQSRAACALKGPSGMSGTEAEDEVRCIHLERPIDRLVPCNQFHCQPRWEVGEWADCSSSCANGTRTRRAYCARENSPGMVELLGDWECRENDLPSLEATCQLPPCPDVYDKSCHRRLTMSASVFSSPGFPLAYPPDQHCVTEISVNQAYWIDITFKSFHLESSPGCIFDFVEILEIEPSTGVATILSKMCGPQLTPFSLVVRSHVAVVRFHSDGTIKRRGFVATFEELDP